MAARRLRQQGTVLLRVNVGADGAADAVVVARSSGSRWLDQAALEAVRLWRFVPGRRGETAIASQVNVPVTFQLTD
jgi:periplasmic protein TonB